MRLQAVMSAGSNNAEADANVARSAPYDYSERGPITDTIEENPDAQGTATRT